ncbi:hypothetical protein ACWCWQ_34350, partial [Streptomyces sp. NPDC001571]
MLAQFPAPLAVPVLARIGIPSPRGARPGGRPSGAGRAWLVAQFPAPLAVPVLARIGIPSPRGARPGGRPSG